jgi:glucose uptake protein
MYIVPNYATAVLFTVITMLCWGSWTNTYKLTEKTWRFELYYWDYLIGIVLFTLFFVFSFGSSGVEGRSFLPDLSQAKGISIWNPILGGIIFNLSNIMLMAAIAIAGMSTAFPVGVGLAMVLGVIINYIAQPHGKPFPLFIGLALCTIAIVIDAAAYSKITKRKGRVSQTGILLSVGAGVLMALFYRFVTSAMADDMVNPEPGKITPYTAMFLFSAGILISNFFFNTYLMRKPIEGDPVTFRQYFRGERIVHLLGVLGGVMWAVATALNFLSGTKAGYAISFGLGQGDTMIGAVWGIVVWNEFKGAAKSVNWMLSLMFSLFISGMALIVYAGA